MGVDLTHLLSHKIQLHFFSWTFFCFQKNKHTKTHHESCFRFTKKGCLEQSKGDFNIIPVSPIGLSVKWCVKSFKETKFTPSSVNWCMPFFFETWILQFLIASELRQDNAKFPGLELYLIRKEPSFSSRNTSYTSCVDKNPAKYLCLFVCLLH